LLHLRAFIWSHIMEPVPVKVAVDLVSEECPADKLSVSPAEPQEPILGKAEASIDIEDPSVESVAEDVHTTAQKQVEEPEVAATPASTAVSAAQDNKVTVVDTPATEERQPAREDSSRGLEQPLLDDDEGPHLELLMMRQTSTWSMWSVNVDWRDQIQQTKESTCAGLSSMLYGVWFVFAPIPLHSLAGSINISSLTNKCCLWFPEYLSQKSKASLAVMALFTYFNWAVIGAFAYATWLVVCASWNLMSLDGTIPKIAKIELLKVATVNVSAVHNVPPLLALAFWMQFSCVIIFFRAFTRTIIHMYARTRGLHVNATARVEYVMDFLIWTGFMGVCALRLGGVLAACDKEMLTTNGLSPLEASLCVNSVQFFVDALFADILLRLLWSCISELLDGDFKRTQAFRLVALLPLVDSDAECSVCLDDDEGERCPLPCRHIFHKECLLGWARQRPCSNGVTCPLCRKTYVSSAYDESVHTVKNLNEGDDSPMQTV